MCLISVSPKSNKHLQIDQYSKNLYGDIPRYCVLPHFEYNWTQCTNGMEKATKTSRTAKHPNSYGKKTCSQMDCEKAPLEKTSVNMALVAFYWPNWILTHGFNYTTWCYTKRGCFLWSHWWIECDKRVSFLLLQDLILTCIKCLWQTEPQRL